MPPRLAEIWAQLLLSQILPSAPISPFHFVNSLFLKRKYNSEALNVVEDPKQNWDDYFDTVIQYMVENLDLDMTYKNKEISVHATASINVYPNKFHFFLH